MQSHHPDTSNYQLHAKKQDARVPVSSLRPGNHPREDQKQPGTCGKSVRARRRRSRLLPDPLLCTYGPAAPQPLPWLASPARHLLPFDISYAGPRHLFPRPPRTEAMSVPGFYLKQHLEQCLQSRFWVDADPKAVDGIISTLCVKFLV